MEGDRVLSVSRVTIPLTQSESATSFGSSATGWVKRHQYLALVGLIYLFEWSFLIPVAADARGLIAFHGPIAEVLGLLSGWGPGLAAVIVTILAGGKVGARGLLRRYLIWRVGLGWYAFALFGTAGFILGGIGLHVLFGGKAPDLPIASVPPSTAALVFGITVAFGLLVNTEDLAWRGFALPRLQPGYGPLAASLLIGVPEGLTHLPYFFIPGDFRQQVGLFWFMAFTIAIVVQMTWLFNRTRGSVLLVALYHAGQNAWANLLDTTPRPGPNDIRPFIFAIVLMWVVTIAIIAVTQGHLGYESDTPGQLAKTSPGGSNA
jgi:membrane protease YdiL (CAAX protease family)